MKSNILNTILYDNIVVMTCYITFKTAIICTFFTLYISHGIILQCSPHSPSARQAKAQGRSWLAAKHQHSCLAKLEMPAGRISRAGQTCNDMPCREQP